MDPRVAAFTERQNGVVARQQLLAAGCEPHDVRRFLRRRELATIHAGVYVAHTGEPTWQQRAWAAVLATSRFDHAGQPAGAALSHASALQAVSHKGATPPDQLHVSVSTRRSVAAPQGVRLHRCSNFEGRIQRNARPPRFTFDHSVIDAAQ